MLFSDLIVWYLFLGGVGGGLCLAALFVEHRARSGKRPWVELNRAIAKPALVVAFTALAAGSACLMKDLALPEKALLLFVKPTFSAITVGTYALTGLMACIALLAVLAFRERAFARPLPGIALRAAAAVLSLVVIVYTGVLLSSMAAVPLWLSVCIPVLFTLSSFSSGIAGVMLLSAFPQSTMRQTVPALRTLLAVDVVLIALEIATVVALAVHLSGDAAALASVEALVAGQLAGQFWIGFAACGLVLPIVLEVVFSSRLSGYPTYFIVLGCLILTGAFFLRYCTIFGGVHLSAFMFAF
ncbi:NrfD/PsrC family molybdoenzyme membrane anchor subunit [Raoultibacter phocaeensis]|uniref:NrfD/PsrC family molybdoenzyme membrane anchor subunit n=1 Tax=Raoultibacter phocaeensis TaxID=2479841 RepID=UPI001117B100|nr:NrfD/PsrC family molybdoenzyme membrane anchor subunit [Raoultibacter phocaeensis]